MTTWAEALTGHWALAGWGLLAGCLAAALVVWAVDLW